MRSTSVGICHGPPKFLKVCRDFGTSGGLADRNAVLAERFPHVTRVVAVADQVAVFPQIFCALEQRRFPCEEPKARQRTSIQDRRVSCLYPKELVEPPDQGGRSECSPNGQLLLLVRWHRCPRKQPPAREARNVEQLTRFEPSLGNPLMCFHSLFNCSNGLPHQIPTNGLCEHMFSALPLKADVALCSRQIRFAPKPEN